MRQGCLGPRIGRIPRRCVNMIEPTDIFGLGASCAQHAHVSQGREEFHVPRQCLIAQLHLFPHHKCDSGLRPMAQLDAPAGQIAADQDAFSQHMVKVALVGQLYNKSHRQGYPLLFSVRLYGNRPPRTGPKGVSARLTAWIPHGVQIGMRKTLHIWVQFENPKGPFDVPERSTHSFHSAMGLANAL